MIIDWDEICAEYQVKITWNTFFYDTSKSVQYHIDNLLLSEDMLQIEINQEKNIIFDVGWPDCFNKNAHFIVYIIQDYDWEYPVKTLRTRNVFQIVEMLQNTLKQYGKYNQDLKTNHK